MPNGQASNEKNSDFLFLWGMMDVPSPNQRHPPCPLWAVQNGWSSDAPAGPLPDLQQLSLGCEPNQNLSYNHLQASGVYSKSDVATFSTRSNSHPSMQNVCKDYQSIPDILSPIVQERNIPPCSLPYNEATQQVQHYSAPNAYQAVDPSSYSPLTYRSLLNQPPTQNPLPASSPCVDPQLNHNQHLASDGGNSGSFVGFNEALTSASAPIQKQPLWSVAALSKGSINDFVPTASPPDHNLTPQSPNSESRYGLNPELLPSAVKGMAEDRAEWDGKVFISEHFSRLPPLPTTSCVIEDRGNVSPLAIRSVTYCVPSDGQTALLSRLPLGVLVTPFFNQNECLPIPLCKHTDCVVGCRWCGASMCPAMGWQDCGQRFHCPFCGKLNEVPWQQYQPTKGAEVRVDKDKRPELSMGSYETLNSEKGEAAALLLAIDVSASALTGGHLEFVTQQIHTLLTSLVRACREAGDASSNLRVGLMTYDSRIHLYDLSPDLSRPHMLVIAETEDLQLPVRERLLVPLIDCIQSIDSVLQLIPQFGAECGDSTGLPIELPVKAGLAVLQGLKCPGKLLIFHTAGLIETGHTNSSSGFFGTSKPKSIFQPSEKAVSLAKECISQGCGVHMFVLSQQDVGGAWPGHIPFLTGGALHTYSYLQGDLDRERFSVDLKRVVETETGYKAELRIFVSKNLRVSGCYGMFVPGSHPEHIALATLHSRTTVAVDLAHSKALDETGGAAVQVVLSYTSQTGERRTRVHTLTLRCSRHLQDTFRNYQAETLLTFYCKKMYCAVLERPLQELREELQTDVTEALASYRKHCCLSSVSAGQLVLPQFLRALPVYVNSLRKSEVLLPGLRSSIHQRLQQRCQVLGLDTRSTVRHFYPLLLPLLPSVDSSSPPYPEGALRCTSSSLDSRGLYLVHAPFTMLLWVGTQVPVGTLVELFNTSCFSSLPSGETNLPALENRLSVRVRSLINSLNSEVPYARKLVVVKQGDTCEEALQHHLVEDKSPNGGASYADFLYHLHVNSVRLLL
ncbi:protein transport protein Sec24C isoform X2 [Poeciliopsis prolifica]|uniref:protein transport protein Sec24C isoform X2 n=1 Tax=Poeciliopsis prolifica TaxID=188132 RepID=UPI002413CB3E|nr:protein transport protein Sec24C isoform X2 [Poeciliopsis prolifica]